MYSNNAGFDIILIDNTITNFPVRIYYRDDNAYHLLIFLLTNCSCFNIFLYKVSSSYHPTLTFIKLHSLFNDFYHKNSNKVYFRLINVYQFKFGQKVKFPVKPLLH